MCVYVGVWVCEGGEEYVVKVGEVRDGTII